MLSFTQLTLHTERLLLRPLCEEDAPALLAIFSDPRVMRYWSSLPWTSIERAHSVIAEDRRGLAAGDYLRLGIVRVIDGQLIGVCSLFNLSEQCRRAEVGYALATAAWGQGYMHEALSALLNCAFGTLALIRIEADIDPRNATSARCLTRLGFQQEGYLRQRWIVDGEISDTAFYGLLAHEWRTT